MPAVVADTHSAIWYLANDPKLPATTAKALDGASAAGDPISAEGRKRLVDALARLTVHMSWRLLTGVWLPRSS